MAAEIVMPRLSDTMEEGRIIKWLKKVGDPIKEGEPLLEVETDKADIEVEAFDTGIITEITADEGETVKVGEKIGLISTEEEAAAKAKPVAEEKKPVEAEAVEAKEEPKREEPEREPEEEKKKEEEEKRKKAAEEAKRKAEEEKRREKPRPKEPAVRVHMETREAVEKFVARPAPGRVMASPLARELAQKHGIDLSEVEGTGPGGEVVRRDIEEVISGKDKKKEPKAKAAAPAKRREIKATPLAVVLAEKEGIELDEVKGTGIDGRIREIDVKAYAARRCAMRGEEYKELSLMRKTIARRMTESVQTIPHFYLTMAIDMGAAMELRKKLNENKGDNDKISVNDIIVKAAAAALEQAPEVNSSFSDDKIKINREINVGVATATPDGLVVPVIFDANKKSVGEIAADMRDKAERAKKRKLKPDEYSHATFTVSNLGMFGIEHFTAIIDPGQSAILAVGAVVKEPVFENDSVKARQTLRVTLSCDHRVVDGYTGTQFLIKLKSILEKPEEAIR